MRSNQVNWLNSNLGALGARSYLGVKETKITVFGEKQFQRFRELLTVKSRMVPCL